MIIRKLFRAENSHIVRNCSSKRCARSLHGHSYVFEVKFKSSRLDRGRMVLDFGLTKSTIKEFIDSFDHAYSVWEEESQDFKEFIYNNSDRYLELPWSPSAETMAVICFDIIDKILNNTIFQNEESFDLELYSVRVHETVTGWAEAYREDLDMVDFTLDDIIFSDGIREEWSFDWFQDLKDGVPFQTPTPEGLLDE